MYASQIKYLLYPDARKVDYWKDQNLKYPWWRNDSFSTQSFHASYFYLQQALVIDTLVDPSYVVESIMLVVSRRFVNFLFKITSVVYRDIQQ